MRHVASALVLVGLGAQSAGLYLLTGGPGLALAVLGSELGLIGLAGVINHAR